MRREVCGTKRDTFDPITLAGLVFEAASGLRREVGPSLERDYELPAQSFEVLIRLARSPGQRLRMTDLAVQTALTPSGLTRSIDRLSEAGLTGREACEDDRRGAFAVLTPLGRRTMEAVLDCHARQLREVFDGLFDPAEWEQLVELLERLRNRVSPDAATVTP